MKFDNKSTYLDNISLKNVKENLILSKESDMDTDSYFNNMIELDKSEPHATRVKTDSVTAVLSVKNLVTRKQSSTKLKHFSRSGKNYY